MNNKRVLAAVAAITILGAIVGFAASSNDDTVTVDNAATGTAPDSERADAGDNDSDSPGTTDNDTSAAGTGDNSQNTTPGTSTSTPAAGSDSTESAPGEPEATGVFTGDSDDEFVSEDTIEVDGEIVEVILGPDGSIDRVEVPNVIGFTWDAAVTLLDAYGFEAETLGVRGEPVGNVTGQFPEAGSFQLVARPVKLRFDTDIPPTTTTIPDGAAPESTRPPLTGSTTTVPEVVLAGDDPTAPTIPGTIPSGGNAGTGPAPTDPPIIDNDVPNTTVSPTLPPRPDQETIPAVTVDVEMAPQPDSPPLTNPPIVAVELHVRWTDDMIGNPEWYSYQIDLVGVDDEVTLVPDTRFTGQRERAGQCELLRFDVPAELGRRNAVKFTFRDRAWGESEFITSGMVPIPVEIYPTGLGGLGHQAAWNPDGELCN